MTSKNQSYKPILIYHHFIQKLKLLDNVPIMHTKLNNTLTSHLHKPMISKNPSSNTISNASKAYTTQ